MHDDYTKFNDIVLIDTTYNTNYYSIPLVVICGVDNNYKNIIFALGLVNDETSQTYQWLLRNFAELTQITPRFVISDGDLALGSAIEKEYVNVPHRLCQWHISRNLHRNFNFLKIEHQDIKEKIFSLPRLDDRETFSDYEKQIMKFLQDNNYSKSVEYLKNLLNCKGKWAKPYYPLIFDGGITTTSRVEGLNSAIKKYLNSKSEISDIITFISDSEKADYLEKPLTVDITKFIEIEPLLEELSTFLPWKVMQKQFEEYSRSKMYINKPSSGIMESQGKKFEVKYDRQNKNSSNNAESKEYRTHAVSYGAKITCNCLFFERTGLICRHIFHICSTQNEKTMQRLVISDRWRRFLIISTQVHFQSPEIKNKEDKDVKNDNFHKNSLERQFNEEEILSSSEGDSQESNAKEEGFEKENVVGILHKESQK